MCRVLYGTSFDFDWSVVRLCDFRFFDSRPFETNAGFRTLRTFDRVLQGEAAEKKYRLIDPRVRWRMMLFASTFVVRDE